MQIQLKNQKGQGVMEYMILSALIGIFCLAGIKTFGDTINKKIKKMKVEINRNIKI
ncbi:MAG: hypothetical protein ISR65_08010 [Bacteriovoracaceae bacterium]|nr:hypothetical protein [Bacteriovoracaceae bacterium]